MTPDVFVDTSGFYSLLVRGDDRHRQASRILREAGQHKVRFITTDYVLDETATLLKARSHGHLVPVLLETVFASAACTVCWTDEERFRVTCDFFLKHEDQAWSFTDCLSFLVMKDRQLRDSLTKDAHFHEAGFQPLLVPTE
ncbi:MAG: PIN domain-containing protein [Thermoguttaceae bacterium]